MARRISINRTATPLDNDDDQDDSFSSNNSDLGIDNICVNIDNYLDEVEKTLHSKSHRVHVHHQPPSSSQGTTASGSSLTTEESKLSSTLSREGSTSNPFIRPSNVHGSGHGDHIPSSRKEYITAIQVPSPVISRSELSDHESVGHRSTAADTAVIQLIWRNLSYQAHQGSLFSIKRSGNRKKILSKQNGGIVGGQITAIIGPSGAGKSTLLECIAGRRRIGLKGDIYVVFDKSLKSGKRTGIKISLIGQKDEAIKTLTVREVLQFSSQIKNYRKANHKYYTERMVESVLQELSLEKCSDVKVGKISGGQLKRLVFGVELISGPDIILLDEPTSGLDASSAYQCVKLLKKLTDLKKNIFNQDSFKSPAIVCSIHQPSSRVLSHFDNIYVLSSDGRCIYQGSPSTLLNHLTKFNLICPKFHNPADFIIEIASGDYGSDPIDQLAATESERQSRELKAEKLVALGGGKVTVNLANVSVDSKIYVKVSRIVERMKSESFPIILHTWLLWKRTMRTNLREPKLTWFRLVQAIFVAVLMAFLYDYPIGEPDGCIPTTIDFSKEFKTTEDNVAFIFFIALFMVMASMMPTVLTFPAEVAILLQERNNGWYSCATYYVAKIIAETPIQIFITMTFVSIIYPMTGQIWDMTRFILFSVVSLLISAIAQCVGILFGTYYVKNVENAVFLAPLSMAPVFLLSGFFGKISAIPYLLKPVAYVSYVRYAFEALLLILYGFDRCPKLAVSSAENVPIQILNTGYVSSHDIDRNRNNRLRNSSRRGSGRLAPYVYWDDYSTTTTTTTTQSPFDTSTNGNPFTGSREVVRNLNPVPGTSTQSSQPSAEQNSYILKHFNIKDDDLWRNLAILAGFLIVLRIVCYIVLLKRTNRRS